MELVAIVIVSIDTRILHHYSNTTTIIDHYIIIVQGRDRVPGLMTRKHQIWVAECRLNITQHHVPKSSFLAISVLVVVAGGCVPSVSARVNNVLVSG